LSLPRGDEKNPRIISLCRNSLAIDTTTRPRCRALRFPARRIQQEVHDAAPRGNVCPLFPSCPVRRGYSENILTPGIRSPLRLVRERQVPGRPDGGTVPRRTKAKQSNMSYAILRSRGVAIWFFPVSGRALYLNRSLSQAVLPGTVLDGGGPIELGAKGLIISTWR
jgi:hypothetical protein